jgi:hypothetical protein
LRSFTEFKKTIQILPYELFILFKEDFLDIVAELSIKDRIDNEDYLLIAKKFRISSKDISKRKTLFKMNQEQINNSNKISSLLEQQESDINPADFLREYGNVKNKPNNYNTLASIFKLNKEKIKFNVLIKLLVQYNPDILCNNSTVDSK